MASLTGNLISSTYQSILKIGTNNTASANLNNVTDGVGNATGLFVSTAGTAVSGSFTVTGSMIVSGTLAATSSNATTASFVTTAQTASYVLNAVSASRATSALSASFAVSASYAQSANNATTATNATNAYNAQYLSSTSSIVVASSSIVPESTDTYTLGSQLNYWKEIYVSTGSIYFVNDNNEIVSSLSATPTGASLGDSLTSTNTGVQMQKLVPAGTINAWKVGSSLSGVVTSNRGIGTETAALSIAGTEGYTYDQFGAEKINQFTVEEYNGTAWSTAAPYPKSSAYTMGVGLQNAALAFGGNTSSFQNIGIINNTYTYDGTAWSSAPNMAFGTYASSGLGTQNEAVSFGGFGFYNNAPTGSVFVTTNLIQGYDGTTWTLLGQSLQYTLFNGASAGTNQNAGLLIGTGWGETSARRVWEWDGSLFTGFSQLNRGIQGNGASGNASAALSYGGLQYSSEANYASTASFASEIWNGTSWTVGSNLVFATSFAGSAGTSNTDALFFGGNTTANEGRLLSNTQIYGSVQLYDTETSFDFDSSTGNLAISGAVSINNVLTLQPFQTLPSASLNPNSFAVSGSKPYFSDGSNWFSLY